MNNRHVIRFSRKHGFSGRRQIMDPDAPAFLALVAFGIVVVIALWCALSDHSPTAPEPTTAMPSHSTQSDKGYNIVHPH
jgi:hypothetical protein